MSDIVKTEAEAIKLAERLLEKAEAHRKQAIAERVEKLGKNIPYSQYIYKLERIIVHSQGWMLVFEAESVAGATVDHSSEFISVNKHTGEAKFGHFRDEEA